MQLMNDVPDLEIRLNRHDSDNYAVEFRLVRPNSDMDIQIDGRMPFDLSKLHTLTLDNEAYGRQLSQYLFADQKLRMEFAFIRNEAKLHDQSLRIRLFVGPSAPELHSLRWETLRDPDTDSPLLTSEQVYFSRYLSSSDWQHIRLRSPDNLKALVLIANPRDLEQHQLHSINALEERTRVVTVLKGMQTTVLVAPEDSLELAGIAATQAPILPATERPTLHNLSFHLRDGYDILYVISHGRLVGGTFYLFLEDENGLTAYVSADDFVARLQEIQQRPRLVVLTACDSAGVNLTALNDPATASDTVGGLATLGPQLARVGIPAILAMQAAFSMDTAEIFMPTFFQELQRDGQIDRAMALARGSVLHHWDAWVPALFMRLRSGRLWYYSGFTDEHGQGDQKWEPLVASLIDRQCTPILGPDLAEGFLGSRREIAWRLAEDYHYPLEPHDREDLPQVAQYLAVHQSDSFLPRTLVKYLAQRLQQRHSTILPDQLRKADLNKISHEQMLGMLDGLITQVWNERQSSDPFEVHRGLAQLPIPVYITADPSSLLFTALERAGKRPQALLCPWNDYTRKENRKEIAQPTEERPLVYYLFGRLQEPASLVLTEEHFFDYLIGVTRNRALIPKRIRSALVDSTLLFLGFRTEDWNFRVFFRSLMNQEGSEKLKDHAHIAVQITPEDSRILNPRIAQQYLETYFAHRGAISVYWGSTEDFVSRLLHKWEGA